MTRKIQTLIVDDEPLARRTLRLLLARDPDIVIAGECRNGMEAATAIGGGNIDLVFLDVQMPRMNGFEVVDAIGAASMPGVVFVTAYDQFALKAFESQALDYLLKPFDDARFNRALHRAKSIVTGGGLGEFSRRLKSFEKARLRSGNFLTRILVRAGKRKVVLEVRDITWIRAADYCVEIHAPTGRFIHRDSLKNLGNKLDPGEFFRCHRSAIVRLSRITEIRPTSRGDHHLVLNDGKKVKLSRGAKARLKRLLS